MSYSQRRASGPSSASTSAQPYTRSRTNLFLSYRDSAIRPSSSAAAAAASASYLGGYGELEYEGGGASGSESKGLLSDDTVLDMSGGGSRRGSAAAGAEALPPKWVDLADRVDDIVEKVKPKSESLRFSGL